MHYIIQILLFIYDKHSIMRRLTLDFDIHYRIYTGVERVPQGCWPILHFCRHSYPERLELSASTDLFP